MQWVNLAIVAMVAWVKAAMLLVAWVKAAMLLVAIAATTWFTYEARLHYCEKDYKILKV
jgi:hypothetical protein